MVDRNLIYGIVPEFAGIEVHWTVVPGCSESGLLLWCLSVVGSSQGLRLCGSKLSLRKAIVDSEFARRN